MDRNTSKKPLVIIKEDINTIAQQGLERALAARHLAELSQSQLNEVSGGQAAVIFGGMPVIQSSTIVNFIRSLFSLPF